MKALILAAGKGTRMHPLTPEIQKQMLPVAGKPILQHAVDDLEEEIEEIIILTNGDSKEVKENLRSENTDLKYIKQEKPLGTAHAVSKVRKNIKKDFLCLNGDVLIYKKYMKRFIEEFKKSEDSLIGTVEVENPKSYGVIDKKGKKVVDILEKPSEPPTNLINAGIYGFTPKIFEAIDETEKSDRGEYEITDSMKILMKEEEIKEYTIPKENWHELSRPWDLLKPNKEVMKREIERKIKGKVDKNVKIEGKVFVEEETRIKHGSYVKGPVYIGKNCEIGPNAFIRPYTHIDDKCKIGNSSEVKNSIVMENTKANHHNYIGDSVVGKNCNLGAGTKIANLRFDHGEIEVTQKGEKTNTGRKKLGAIIGHNVKTGVNSNINPGTIVDRNSFLGPGKTVKGEVKKGRRSK